MALPRRGAAASLWVTTPRRSHVYLRTEARTGTVQLGNKRRAPVCEEPCSHTHTPSLPRGRLPMGTTASAAGTRSLSPGSSRGAWSWWKMLKGSQGGRGPPPGENEQGGGSCEEGHLSIPHVLVEGLPGDRTAGGGSAALKRWLWTADKSGLRGVTATARADHEVLSSDHHPSTVRELGCPAYFTITSPGRSSAFTEMRSLLDHPLLKTLHGCSPFQWSCKVVLTRIETPESNPEGMAQSLRCSQEFMGGRNRAG